MAVNPGLEWACHDWDFRKYPSDFWRIPKIFWRPPKVVWRCSYDLWPLIQICESGMMSLMQEITAFSPQAWNSLIRHIGQLAGISPPRKGWLGVWVSLSRYHPYQGNRVWKDWGCMDLKPQVKFLYIHESLYLLEWFHESRDYRWWTYQVHQWFLNSDCSTAIIW